MARNIHSNYYEDNYCKHECQDCRRCFIVGEVLSENMPLSCPYCQSRNVEMTAGTTEDMDMGCLGIYFHRYDDGKLMLYTEEELAEALGRYRENAGGNGVPLSSVPDIITDFCVRRDWADACSE